MRYNVLPSDQFLEALETRQVLAADLSLSLGNLTVGNGGVFNNNLVQVPVVVTNIGDVRSADGATVRFFLSTDTTLDPADFRAGDTDLTLPGLDPAASDNQTFNFRRMMVLDPASPLPNVPPGNYFVIGQIIQAAPDANPANDTAATANTVTYSLQFGTVDGQANTPLLVTVANGNMISFRLAGPGTGDIRLEAGQYLVTLTGTTERSLFTMSGAFSNPSTPTINGVDVQGSLSSFF